MQASFSEFPPCFFQRVKNLFVCLTCVYPKTATSFKICVFPCFVLCHHLGAQRWLYTSTGRGGGNVLTNKYTCACMQAHSCIPHIPSINSTHDHIFLLLTQIMVLLSFPEGTILTWTSNKLPITLFFFHLWVNFLFSVKVCVLNLLYATFPPSLSFT